MGHTDDQRHCTLNFGFGVRLMANQSLNWTHCGMRPKARHFILGF